jgi:hypothetical protein
VQANTNAAGPRVALSDAAGIPRAAIGVTGEGPVLAFADALDKPRATLAAPAGGPASLVLLQADGKVSWRAP